MKSLIGAAILGIGCGLVAYGLTANAFIGLGSALAIGSVVHAFITWD